MPQQSSATLPKRSAPSVVVCFRRRVKIIVVKGHFLIYIHVFLIQVKQPFKIITATKRLKVSPCEGL